MSDVDDLKQRPYGEEYANSLTAQPRTSRCHHGNFVCQVCIGGKDDVSECCGAPINDFGFCTSCKEHAEPGEME